jgi:hypothetical protein
VRVRRTFAQAEWTGIELSGSACPLQRRFGRFALSSGRDGQPAKGRELTRSCHPKRTHLLGGWKAAALGAHATIHCDQAQAKTDRNDASDSCQATKRGQRASARASFPKTNVSGVRCRKRSGSLVLETSSAAALEPTAMQCSSASLLRTFLGDGPADAKGASECPCRNGGRT